MKDERRERGSFLAKKSLGQNFLTSEKALNDIVRASGAGKGDAVLEIGPGKGALTRKLLAAGARVVAIEKDDRLIPRLAEEFAAEIADKKIRVVRGDALEIEPACLPELSGGFRVVANIPYYITGAFLRKYLSGAPKPSSMTILVQKEVAERIVAKDGKESILSISVKAYGIPSYIGTVKAGSFSPAPSIDSAIIHIASISAAYFKGFSEEEFFSIIKAAFSMKRKTLRNTLGKAYGEEKAERALETCGISARARAEDLAIGDWPRIARELAR